MAKAYWIANVTVTNPDNYAAYQSLAPEAFSAYGARFIARGGRNEALEGRQTPQRTVVIEFPSYQHACDCYHSTAYRRARDLRENAAEVDIIIVEGLVKPCYPAGSGTSWLSHWRRLSPRWNWG